MTLASHRDQDRSAGANSGLTRPVSSGEGLVVVGVALLGALVFRALTGSTGWAVVTACLAVVVVFIERDVAARRTKKKTQQRKKESDHGADEND
jgi:Flp pilus assembly protein TadB